LGRAKPAKQQVFGAHQRAIRALMETIASREIAAGVEPAHWHGKAATLAGGRAYDVSILLGVGHQLGWHSRRVHAATGNSSASRSASHGAAPWHLRQFLLREAL